MEYDRGYILWKTQDEGFLSGILYSHTKINFTVKETDCWCTGDRVCRFVISKA
ncbi:MAG: 4-vinyl reductase [Spirochaetes bacterium]|nr:4-vinyl reductase [Spirochaetota bacterium]